MKRILVWLLILSFMLCSMAFADDKLTTEEKYEQAQIYLAENNFEAAVKLFEEIQGYKDSSQYVVYARALMYAEKGEYSIATNAFNNLGSFRDSAQQKIYYEGRSYEDQDDFSGLTKAKSVYEKIMLFRDCLTRMDAIDRRIEEIYLNAIQLGESGEYGKACAILSDMKLYKEASSYKSYYYARDCEKINSPERALAGYRELNGFLDSEERFNTLANKFIHEIKVGDSISLGRSSWQVLDVDVENKRLLLIAKYAVDPELAYGYMNVYTTWKDSQIREWLNNSFFYSQFSEMEAALIEEVTLEETAIEPGSTDNTYKIGYTGATTTDRIFVLSVEEAYRYFKSDDERALQYQHAYWWLRDGGRRISSGSNQWGSWSIDSYVAACVDPFGSIGANAPLSQAGGMPLRPSFYLNLNWGGEMYSDESSNPSALNENNQGLGFIDAVNEAYESTLIKGYQHTDSGIACDLCVEHYSHCFIDGDFNSEVLKVDRLEVCLAIYEEGIAEIFCSMIDGVYGIPKEKSAAVMENAITQLKTMKYKEGGSVPSVEAAVNSVYKGGIRFKKFKIVSESGYYYLFIE